MRILHSSGLGALCAFVVHFHSHSALIGSTRVARSAGSRQDIRENQYRGDGKSRRLEQKPNRVTQMGD